MDGLILAFGFLTVIPMPFLKPRAGGMGRAAMWFPVVGLVVGAILAGVGWGANWLWHDRWIAAALVLMANLLLTGGLHLDGFMDTADAFFSHRDHERMLEIMRDSRSGALGVASGVVLLLTKFTAVSALLAHPSFLSLYYLALTPLLGRTSIIFATRFPCARDSGLGASFTAEVRSWQRELAILLTLVIVVAILRWHGVILFVLSLLVALLSSFYWQRRLGGLTGDIYGATNECVELVIFLTGAFLVR